MTALRVLLACGWLAPSLAAAQPAPVAVPSPPAPPTAPTGESIAPAEVPAAVLPPASERGMTIAVAEQRKWIEPALTLTGSTTGEGTIAAGLDLLTSVAPATDLRAKLVLEAASSDGLATLVTGSLDGAKSGGSWLGGADITLASLQRKTELSAKALDVDPATRQKLVLACIEDRGFSAAWNGAARRVDDALSPHDALIATIDEFESGALCPAALKGYLAKEIGATLPLPRQQLSIGFRYGSAVTSYLRETTTPGEYAFVKDDHRRRGVVGGRYTHFWASNRLTAEGALRYEHSVEPQPKKARWCAPSGVVQQPTGSVPAEVCREHPLGEPTDADVITLSGHLGVVGADSAWRAAVGVRVRYTISGDVHPYDFGVELPTFLMRASPQYAGLVRVVPWVGYARDADGKGGSKVLLTLSLLGDRTLFQTALQ